MATVYLSVGQVGARGNTDSVTVFLGDTVTTEVVTSGLASVQATIVTSKNDFAQLYCETPVMVLTGENPTASATNGLYCPAGTISQFAVQANHRIAIIDAP